MSEGEIKLSTIQKNIKRVMREEFSLFSLGIGFDVDFDFLERIATENRGIAQRIFANHNAADQLRVQELTRADEIGRPTRMWRLTSRLLSCCSCFTARSPPPC